jgi:hypothetical protein
MIKAGLPAMMPCYDRMAEVPDAGPVEELALGCESTDAETRYFAVL